jgi:hypothetical protein
MPLSLPTAALLMSCAQRCTGVTNMHHIAANTQAHTVLFGFVTQNPAAKLSVGMMPLSTDRACSHNTTATTSSRVRH